MSDIATRLASLESELEALHNELARIQDKIDRGTPEEGLFDKMLKVLSATSTIIAGVIVVVVGYFLTDSVNHALQQHQIEVSSGQAMEQLLEKLRDPRAAKNDADATAITLASAFGNDAAVALIMELEDGNEVTVPAAEKGLRALALKDQTPTCNLLVKVLTNESRLFSWRTHEAAVRLIGDLDCPNAKGTLAEYKAELASIGARNAQEPLAEYQKIFAPEPPVDEGSVKELSDQLDKEIALVQVHSR
jgi:ankyrin repeat protein